MSRLLYIEASPRNTLIEVAKTFLETYQKSHPEDHVETLDLWQKEIPRFDGDTIDAKYAIMHGQAHTEAQRKSWRAVELMIAEFKQADRYLFSLPMWNFGIPYPQALFRCDCATFYAFTYSPTEEYKGLVTGRPVVLIYSREAPMVQEQAQKA